MDRRGGLGLVFFYVVVFVGLMLAHAVQVANANLVIPVERKFKGPVDSLGAIKAHDSHRHGRFLSAVDVPLGGNGIPSSTGFVPSLPTHFVYFVLSCTHVFPLGKIILLVLLSYFRFSIWSFIFL